jgi:hypothetical protein
VSLGFRAVGGKVECTDVRIEPIDQEHPPAVTTEKVLRRIPLARFVDKIRIEDLTNEMGSLVGIPGPGRLGDLAQEAIRQLSEGQQSKRGRPRTRGKDHFAEVARVYVSSPTKPTKAVAEHFDVTSSTAANWVSRARELGLIAPTTRGRASGASDAARKR